VECDLPNCQNCRQTRYKLWLKNELSGLKNRRAYLDAMTVGPDENGVLHDYHPIPDLEWEGGQPTNLAQYRKATRNSTQSEALEEALLYCPDTMSDRQDDMARERALNLELLQRKVQRADMEMLRLEILELIKEERSARREGNARFKLFMTIMCQCVKLIDLWEEGCSTMDTITKKNEFIGKRKDLLNEKIAKRLGLEQDNQGLRDSIADLQRKLHTTRQDNLNRDKRYLNLTQDKTEAVTMHKQLNTRVNRAKSGQKALQEAFVTAEESLKSAFESEEMESLGLQ